MKTGVITNKAVTSAEFNGRFHDHIQYIQKQPHLLQFLDLI